MDNKRKTEHLTEIEKETQLYEKYAKKMKRDERLEIKQRNNGEFIESQDETEIQPEWEEKIENKAISFGDLQKNMITRTLLAKNVYKPFFNLVKGNMVRVSMANGYAICKILDIKYGKEYMFPLDRNSFRTDKYLTLKHGDNKFSVPISYISNSPIIQEEYDAQRKSDLPISIINDYARIEKLLNRQMSKEEQRKYEDEKRNFMCNLSRRRSYYKTDLMRKRKDALNDRKPDLAKEMVDVIYKFCDDDEPLSDLQVNAYARKYNLNVPGGEVDIDTVKIKHEK